MTQASPGKFDRLPRTPAGSTALAIDGLWTSRLVARSSDQGCLVSDFCSSGRGFAPHCLQTPPRDDALVLRYSFTSIRVDRGLPPPSDRACWAHDWTASPRGVRHRRPEWLRVSLRPARGQRSPTDLETKGDDDDTITMPDDRGHDPGGIGAAQPSDLRQVGLPAGGRLPTLAGRVERRGGALVSGQTA